MIPLGIANANTTLIGNAIGNGDSEKAKRYHRAILKYSMFVFIIITILFN